MWQLFLACKFDQFMLMINNIFAFYVAPSSCIYMFDYSISNKDTLNSD